MYAKSIDTDKTVVGRDEGSAPLLSAAAVEQEVQRMPGAFCGAVFDSFSLRADPSIPEEPQSLHAVIRIGSSGWGGLRHIGAICRCSEFYLAV
jgi:hypothetical protein